MGRLKKGLIGAIVLGVIPISVSAQTPASQTSAPQAPTTPPPTSLIFSPPGADKPAEVGGLPTFDIITLGAIGPGAPLRYGNVIPNSEQVQLNGITLMPLSDYLMDYAVGVVYLKVAQSAGQQLTVSYRYKPGPAAPPGFTQFSALSAYTYAVAPGSLNFLSGIGVTERASNGSVMSNNVFGFNNTFKLGQGMTLNGLYLVGDRQQEQDTAGMTMDMNVPRSPTNFRAGNSQLILQNFDDSSFLGGSAHMDYQDVSRNFNGYSGLSGVDAATASRLYSERGLTRFGYDIDRAKLGCFTLSNSYHDVSDGYTGIYWRSYGVQNGGFGLNYSAQQVGETFNRFSDLSNSNKDQLRNETGMSRSVLNFNWAEQFGKISYTGSKISDDLEHTSIHQNAWAINTSKLRFNIGDESVDGGFTRLSNLLAPEQAEYGREAGIKRQWMGLQASLLGTNLPFSFNQTMLSSPVGNFKAEDAAIGSRSWNLQHVERNAGTGWASMGAMSDAEVDANVRSIANMYAYDIKPTAGDRGEFMSQVGIDRKYNGFMTDALPGWKINASALDIKGQEDKASVDAFSAASKNAILTYRKEDLGLRFNEITNMMDFEKLRLGTLQGLNREDADLILINGTRKLEATGMDLTTPTGSARRSTVAYDDPNKLNIVAGSRSVSQGFEDGPSLVDPEKNLLQTLQGYNEMDIKAKWVIRPGSTLDTFDEEQYDPQRKQTWTTRNTILNAQLDKYTNVNITDLEQHNNDPMSTIFSSVVEKMSLTRDMGKYGILKVLDERDEYDGNRQNLLDNHLQYIGYQAKITGSTTFKTEQTHTTYENGVVENINSNTVSQDINKRAGVSVTDTEVNRTGTNDESHKNYGFWYDLGNGVKLSYGYAKQIMPDGSLDTTNQSLTLGKAPAAGQPANSVQAGQVGNLMLAGAYNESQWAQSDRTQSNGNIAVTTVKPLNYGSFQDGKITVNLDSGSDYSKVIHENKLVSGQGRVGTYLFGYEYKSQMDPTGNRAIDRTVKLQTDPSEKKLISAGISYRDRTMPDNSTIIIRDYNLTFRPAKNLTLVNLLQTNPDIANPGAILGSIPQASRSDKWNLDYKQNPNLTVGGQFQELINDQTNSASQTAGVTAKLFDKIGSPVSLFYGLEAANQTNLWRKTQRYSLQFDQRPGKNQTLSLFVGNLSYEHSVPVGSYSNNNTFRLNYQYRF